MPGEALVTVFLPSTMGSPDEVMVTIRTLHTCMQTLASTIQFVEFRSIKYKYVPNIAFRFGPNAVDVFHSLQNIV